MRVVSEVVLRKREPGWALVIPATAQLETLDEVRVSLFPELWQKAAAWGAGRVGVPFLRYTAWNADGTIEVEAGIRVAKAVEGKGDVECVEMAGGEEVMAEYLGPVTGVGEAHVTLGAWVRAEERETAGPLEEYYHTDAGEDEERVEVVWPVR